MEKEIIQDYVNKVLTQDIMKKYNISWKKLNRILKNAGVYQKSSTIKIDSNKIEKLLKAYFVKSNKELSKELKISEDYIRVIAVKNGLPLKGSGWKYRPEILSYNFDNPIYKYFLGWVAADGSLNNKFQGLSLSITDKEIIDKFLVEFPFSTYRLDVKEKQKDIHQLFISSTFFIKKVLESGLTPNKTYNLKLNEEYFIPEFMRGFFEGDGHIRRGKNRKEFGFVTASENFAYQIQNYLKSHGILIKIFKEDEYFRLRGSGKESILKFFNLIYGEEKFWILTRKHQIFIDLLFSNEQNASCELQGSPEVGNQQPS